MATALAIALAALSCPAPEAVELKLAALRGPGADAPRYRLEVDRQGESVLLTARDAEGALWVQRELPAAAPCAELEDAAAVVLLAWEAQLQPGEVPVPEVSRPMAPPPPVATVEPAPSLNVRVNAAGQLWLSSASPTWGAGASVELHGRWLGLELGVLGQGLRDVALGTGRASWSRFSVWVGPVVSLRLAEGVELALSAALVGGAFSVRGTGFDSSLAVMDWDLGALAQVKVMLPGLWRVRPYLAVGGAWWARRHMVQARTPDASFLLPFLEASPTVGFVFTP